MDSLGSVDPLKGQRPSPLEAPPIVGLAFVLHLVGKEPCQKERFGFIMRTYPEPGIFNIFPGTLNVSFSRPLNSPNCPPSNVTEHKGIQQQLLLLSRFSRVRLCATPETAAHQAPLSLGFSRHEHWSGLPFPSPMHESEKSK